MEQADNPNTVHFVEVEQVIDAAVSLFEEQRQRILAVMPSADVQHIGSTAVPRTITKGDLDINVRVLAEEFAEAIAPLEEHYEINQPQNWTEDFASFKDDSRNLGIQLTVRGTEADDFVSLRDLLLTRPDLVERCNELKMRHQNGDMDIYRREKAELYELIRRENKG